MWGYITELMINNDSACHTHFVDQRHFSGGVEMAIVSRWRGDYGEGIVTVFPCLPDFLRRKEFLLLHIIVNHARLVCVAVGSCHTLAPKTPNTNNSE